MKQFRRLHLQSTSKTYYSHFDIAEKRRQQKETWPLTYPRTVHI